MCEKEFYNRYSYFQQGSNLKQCKTYQNGPVEVGTGGRSLLSISILKASFITLLFPPFFYILYLCLSSNLSRAFFFHWVPSHTVDLTFIKCPLQQKSQQSREKAFLLREQKVRIRQFISCSEQYFHFKQQAFLHQIITIHLNN